jgi:RHS repeat-associated protein
MRRSTFLTRTTIAVVAVAVVAAGSQTVATASTNGWHGLGWDLPALQVVNAVDGQIGTNRPVKTSPPAPSAPAPKVSWPAAASYQVGVSPTAGVRQSAGDVSVARDVSATPHSTGKFQVDTIAHDTAAKAHIAGSLIQVKPVSGDTSGPISVQLNYGGSASAYGADYGRRLRFVQYPACVLSTPDQKKCQQATPLVSSNDTKAQKVSTDVTLPSAKDSVVVAAVAGASSDSGDFAATKLSPAGSWTSGGAGGDFNYSYPIGVPAALGGSAPGVALAYSSGSVDGLTAATNAQPSWVGDGWDLSAGGFIQRSYKPCAQDLGGNNGQRKTGDACWATDNATISFGGISGPLVTDGTSWHPKNDDGTRIEHLTGGVNGDNDGEYWRVTTRDGTQAYFGLNHAPGWQNGNPETNSTWTEPVFGNNAGEPCNQATFASSACDQAWRWNLDYVVDPHGNATIYYYDKETNYYSKNLDTQAAIYTRGGYLDHIDYGLNTNVGSLFTAAPPAQVRFTAADRCAAGAGASTCDVPTDLVCDGTATCAGTSPTYFSSKKLTSIATLVADGHGGQSTVNQWNLSQSLPSTGDGNSPALWLDSITHVGGSGSNQIALPPTTFLPKLMANRVDLTHNYTAINRNRIETIVNQQGGTTTVTYSAPDCTPTTEPSPANNGTRCFPTFWTPGGATEPVLDWFNKYVVTQITDDGRTPLSQPMLTSYTYGTGPNSAAWHYDENVLSDDKYRTYSEWRGYDVVTTTKGQANDPAGPQVVSKSVYMRGMDGATVPSVQGDIPGPSTTDAKQYAGFQRETVSYSNGTPIAASISDPWSSAATGTDKYDGVQSFMTGTAATTGLTWLAASNTWRTSKTVNTFDSLGQIKTTETNGDVTDPKQSTCTTFTYAQNTGAWMMSYPSQTQKIAGTCAGNTATSDNIITDVHTLFDGQASGAAPSKGEVSEVDSLDSWPTAGTEKFQLPTSKMTYDVYGRLTATTDVLGRTTTTAYTPQTGGPVTQIAATTPPINSTTSGLTTTKIFDPVTASVVTEIDGSGLRTDGTYDALGRLIAEWAPGESKTANQPPNVKYSYNDNTDKPSTVVTNTLLRSGQYATSYALVDGLGNTVQTQSPSPKGGRLVSDTFFDSQDRAWKAHAAYWNNASVPGADLLVVQDNAVANTSVSTFDSAGRTVTSTYQLNGVPQWHSTSTYDGDRVTSVPPNGGTATTVITNGLGQKTNLLQYKDPTKTGPGDAADVTSYTYNRFGLLASTTDPTGKNVWTTTYDLHGNKIASTDPDVGASSYTYDAAGQLKTTTDGRGKTLAYTYDGIGRKTGEYVGSTTGPQLAAWTYDTLVKGLPSSSTRYDNGNAYTTSVYKYDAAGRPLGVQYSIPSAEGFLAGNYLFQVFYDAYTGQVTRQSSPAAGGLDATSIVHGYDTLGDPTTLDEVANDADTPLVAETDYSAYGQVLRNVLADPKLPNQIAVTNVFDPGTGRLQSSLAERATSSNYMISNKAYGYDNAGNITSIADTPQGVAADVQCFSTDYLQRLSQAWTPSSGSCSTAPSATALGGPAPYWQSWTYDLTGNRRTQVQHAASGDTTSTYNYPDPGASQPHTLLNVQTSGPGGSSQNTYTYDTGGNTKTRNIAGSTQTYTYNDEGSIASEQDALGGTSTYVNDASGNRLITRDSTGTTLSIGDLELHLPPNGRFPTGIRYYSFNGQKVAERGSVNGLSWALSDHQGTTYASVNAGDLAVTQRRQDPFGNSRGAAGLWPDRHGFVGGIQDASGLTQLGARGYDSATGRFTQADPVLNPGDPQAMNGYAYSKNTPITGSDPSGLATACTDGGEVCETYNPHGGSKCPGGYCEHINQQAMDQAKRASSGNTPSTTPTQNASPQPERSSCSWWEVVCSIEQHMTVFIAVVTVVAVAATVACAIMTAGTCLIAVAAGATEGAMWGGTGMLIGAAVSAGAEVVGALAVAGGAGLAAAEVAEVASADAGKIDGAGSNAVTKAAASDSGGVKAAESETPTAEPPTGERPSEEPSTSEPAGCKNSFAAGTAVLMADGSSKPIQDVHVGDQITNKDPETGQVQTHTVMATHITDNDTDFVDLTVQTPSVTSTITVTAYHLFWDATTHSWTAADNLRVGDEFDGLSGLRARLTVNHRFTAAIVTYNLTVDDVHTFYIIAGSLYILVHNCNPVLQQLAGRASEIHAQAGSPIAIEKTTVSVIRASTPKGPVDVVAGSGRGLNAAQKAMLGPGEIPARNIPGTHAEQNALLYINEMGWTPLAGAASRSVCSDICAVLIRVTGGRVTGQVFQRESGTMIRTFEW